MGPIEKDLQETKGKLRGDRYFIDGEYVKKHKITVNPCTSSYDADVLLALLDELEEEHKTEIPQPVDADGIPWTGEERTFLDDAGVEHCCTTMFYNLYRKEWYMRDSTSIAHGQLLNHLHHVKPKRSLEEIVKDINAAINIDSIGNVNVTEELLLDLTELHEHFADDSNVGDE